MHGGCVGIEKLIKVSITDVTWAQGVVTITLQACAVVPRRARI
jgi:hypothetical protein